MVYYFEKTDALSLPALLPLMSEGRKKKIAAYRNPGDKKNAAAAFLLLRYGLFKEHGIEEMPQFLPNELGKPELQWPHIHFNLSHSAGAAVCAISADAVGVDIQKRSLCRPSVLCRAFSEAERRAVEAASDPDGLFTAIWSRKEAYGKATGLGIRYSMRETDFSEPCTLEGFQITTYALEGYSLSLCAREPLEVHKVTLDKMKRCSME